MNQQWRSKAACQGLDPEIFYPLDDEDADEAKAVCATCTVRESCLEHALGYREKEGVWGGATGTRAPADHPPAPPHRLARPATWPQRPGPNLTRGTHGRDARRPRRLASGAPGRSRPGATSPADEGRAAMTEILAGAATDAQIAGLHRGAAHEGRGRRRGGRHGRRHARGRPTRSPCPPTAAPLVDIVGTGGGATAGPHALNVSTMACFVVAGAGVPVCKHGNRKAIVAPAARSTCSRRWACASTSTAPASPAASSEAGIGFCFARAFHPAMRHAGPVRAELGIPTVFNFLGPLSNPARVDRQVIGVNDPAHGADACIGVLQPRGAPRAMVVHGHDGMDELTITGRSTVWELRDGDVPQYDLDPRDLGHRRWSTSIELGGGDAAANAAIAGPGVRAASPGPTATSSCSTRPPVCVVGGVVDDLAAGLELARRVDRLRRRRQRRSSASWRSRTSLDL